MEIVMKRNVILACLVACAATPAAAQTKGKVSVGGSVTYLATTDGEVGNVFGGGPLIRLNPRKGWGVAGALNWFTANIDNPTGASGDFARLRVRHLMGGVA